VDPTLVRVGGLRVSVYGFFLLAGIAVALYRFTRTGGRAGLSRSEALDLGLYVALAGLVGARVGYVLGHAGAYRSAPERALWLWQDGGLAFYGGVAAAVVTCRLLRPHRWVETLDALAAPAALGYAVGVAAAFWGVLFLGRPTDLPWAVDVGGTLRHPVGGYLMLASLVAYRVLEAASGVPHPPGHLTLTYLVMHGAARFAAELFADPQAAAVVGPLSLGQVAAAAVAAAGAVGLWGLERRRGQDGGAQGGG
jgi:prolipoprotein diacylglyceryltransferase